MLYFKDFLANLLKKWKYPQILMDNHGYKKLCEYFFFKYLMGVETSNRIDHLDLLWTKLSILYFIVYSIIYLLSKGTKDQIIFQNINLFSHNISIFKMRNYLIIEFKLVDSENLVDKDFTFWMR